MCARRSRSSFRHSLEEILRSFLHLRQERWRHIPPSLPLGDLALRQEPGIHIRLMRIEVNGKSFFGLLVLTPKNFDCNRMAGAFTAPKSEEMLA